MTCGPSHPSWLWSLLLILGAIANPNFIGIDNLLNVITRSAFIAIIAVGATFVISAGGLDLSVGSMVAFVASLMIMFMNSGVIADPATMLVVAMALAIVIGAACGLANGLITTAGSIEPFIATLGTMGIYRGLRRGCRRAAPSRCGPRRSSRSTVPPISARFSGFRSRSSSSLSPPPSAAFVLHRTRYGRHVLAVGSNQDVARYSGIPVDRVRTVTYVIQGLCVAVAMSALRAAPGINVSNDGLMWELQAITAVVVGGTALRGGVGRIWGTICGAFILEIVGNIMLLSNFVSEYLIGAIQGAIIIVAMLVQRSLVRKS